MDKISQPSPALPRSLENDNQENALSPTPSTLNEDIYNFLEFIGLNEESLIDSNTPLNIIRHFAGEQSYELALCAAFDSTLLTGVILIIFTMYRVSVLVNGGGFDHIFSSIFNVWVRILILIVSVYGFSSASILMHETNPLSARDFTIFVLWSISLGLLATKAIIHIEVFWTISAFLRQKAEEQYGIISLILLFVMSFVIISGVYFWF